VRSWTVGRKRIRKKVLKVISMVSVRVFSGLMRFQRKTWRKLSIINMILLMNPSIILSSRTLCVYARRMMMTLRFTMMLILRAGLKASLMEWVHFMRKLRVPFPRDSRVKQSNEAAG
jgi:hypothetical protein